MRNLAAIFCFLLLPGSLYAQEVLTLEQALAEAMENNHGITIARNNARISRNNIFPGNAGLLPRLDLNLNSTYSRNNTDLHIAGETGIRKISVDGAQSQGNGANVGFSYTLFDGLGSVYTYQRLKNIGVVSELQARAVIEGTLLQVIAGYLEVARLSEASRTAGESVNISRERMQRARNRYEWGSANRVEALTAEVDYNNDSLAMANTGVLLKNAQRNLNALLGRDVAITFKVLTGVEFKELMQAEVVKQKAAANNSALVLATAQQRTAELDRKIANSSLYPRLNLTSSYGYSRNDNDASIVLMQQNLGFNAGVGISFNIFDGRRRAVQVQNARIAMENSHETYEQARLQVDRDVLNAYDVYQHSFNVLNMEKKNLATAELAFERMQELYNMGHATGIQFREAQMNVLRAKDRITNATFTAKLAEVELTRLSGELMQ